MRSPAIVPALALVAGAGCGVSWPAVVPHVSPLSISAGLLGLLVLARPIAARRRAAVVAAAFALAGFLHGATVRDAALHTSLRTAVDRAYGGFSIESIGVSGVPAALRVRATLTEDAADEGDFVSMQARVSAVHLAGVWQHASGGVVISVSGEAAHLRKEQWRAGRTIEAPVIFRRPARYLDAGVPDFERDTALGGITLFGTIKSALVVETIARGTPLREAAANARVFVRREVTRWVAPHGALSAAIVTAVLIGDRTGLPDAVRDRLQAAGTYHVIAISGGNIAILAGLLVALCAVAGLHGRSVAALAIVALIAYAGVVSSGPSVWRATLMAVIYFGARLFDHRAPAWHAVALAAGLMAAVQPLDVRAAGFLLTFGATGALLETARLLSSRMRARGPLAWLVGSVAASLAAEIALLPVSAAAFSRVTGAGPLLNLVAVPMMGIVQVAGLAAVAFTHVPLVAGPSGWIAAQGAAALVESARLVELVPGLVRRVPSPPAWLVAAYYLSLLGALRAARPRLRRVAMATTVLAAALIVFGLGRGTGGSTDGLRFTVFDVGQGDAMLLELPDAGPLLIDTGGSPFGGGNFDIGVRVLAPALWARGVRRLDTLLVTHGDPDHLGGASAMVEAFAPRHVWWGIAVPPHQPSREFLASAAARQLPVEWRRAGQALSLGRARVRVLNPPAPDWDRQRVRNDDSVVLEVVYGDVALLLTGDIGADLERAIAPQLTPARIRILKVAHHGSRTSTSQALLDAWRPQIAVISCGRGNAFGHPAPDVIGRLTSIGAQVYRTDRDGEITITSEGRHVQVATFTGERQ